MAKQTKDKTNGISYRINDEITNYNSVRIVGEGIENKVISLNEAKHLAEKMELDLIEINSRVNPPIMRIGNYEKLLYEMKKNAKRNKQKITELKEIQLSVNIAKHDLDTKVKKAASFLEEGHKVKVVLTMKGREMSRREENKRSILEFIVMLEDVAVPESNVRDEGNKTIVILKKKKIR